MHAKYQASIYDGSKGKTNVKILLPQTDTQMGKKLDNAKRGISSQGGKVDLDLRPRDQNL